MDLKAIAESLSKIEQDSLKALSEGGEMNAKELGERAGIGIDSARRAMAWMAEKKIVDLSESGEIMLGLTAKGKTALEKGLPEERMLNSLSGRERQGFDDLKKSAELDQQEFNIALGLNKRNAYIAIVPGKQEIEITEVGKDFLSRKSGKSILSEIENTAESEVANLIKRGLVEKREAVERKVKINSPGEKVLSQLKGVKERKYNIHGEVPKIFIGKKQPYVQFLNSVRRKLTELGFKEMYAPLVVQEFYNFDVLFQPQNHPARSWSDTYQLKNPKLGKLPDKKIVKAVKDAHETGGVSASSGWGYSWVEEIAAKLMPAAHGTAHSARQLIHNLQVPGKYFAIARCFRPDVLDATHLIEFNQCEGFIVGEDLNFRHLLGMLKQFAIEFAGAEEVKFYPDYYPFTEPSVQLSAKHPDLGWIELGGSGMFRPEMLENLGIKGQAIAWGIGIDRLAMFKLGIKDIRYLFSEDLNWLRNSKMVK
ncbi:MAG: phenylalanine--tRNA ligase subunit alpha [Candidatus Diapherotrites archaeon]